jgi:hypothetical protein
MHMCMGFIISSLTEFDSSYFPPYLLMPLIILKSKVSSALRTK